MVEILSELASIELQGRDSKRLEEITERLMNYYNDNGRHLYSEVSSFIYKTKEENFEYIIENLIIIKEYYNNSNLDEYENKIFKLIDHIQLEMYRDEHIKKGYQNAILSMVDETKNDIKTFDEKIHEELNGKYEDLNTKYEEINNVYKEMNKKSSTINKNIKVQRKNLDNLYTSIISILGIFAAIVIAFFGGLSILGSVLQNMHNVSKYRLSFTVLLIGLFMYNVIFMLLYIISKLTNKKIKSKCNKGSCTNCNRNASLDCLKNRYPSAYWFNLGCVVLIVSIFTMYMVDKYNIITYIMQYLKMKDTSMIPVIGLGIVMIIIGALVVIGYLIIRYTKKPGNSISTDN